MDPRLAELYGTNQPDETDLEKLAAAQLADDLSEDGEIDLDNIDEDDIEELAQSVLDGEEEDEGGEDGGEEKLAEADFLGRVMAHAYVQEMRGIEKDAADVAEDTGRPGVSPPRAPFPEEARRFQRTGATAALGKMTKKRAWEKGKSSRKMTKKTWLKSKARRFGRALAGGGPKAGRKERILGVKGFRGRTWGARGALIGGAAAAGYGAKKAFEKKSSALDTLAMQRAEEILAENGVETQEVEPYDVLAQAVENRAMEILAENGYEVEDE